MKKRWSAAACAIAGVAAMTIAGCGRNRIVFDTIQEEKLVRLNECEYELDYSFSWPVARRGDRALERITAQMASEFFGVRQFDGSVERAAAEYERALAEEWDDPTADSVLWSGYFTSSSVCGTVLEGRVLNNTIYKSCYTGGAHGMYNTFYHNYRLSDGSRIALAEAVDAQALETLLPELIRRTLRAAYGAADDEGLRQLGFFDPAGIGPTENFLLTDRSMVFCYGPYEEACYAVGEVFAEIPYEELQGHLLPLVTGR